MIVLALAQIDYSRVPYQEAERPMQIYFISNSK